MRYLFFAGRHCAAALLVLLVHTINAELDSTEAAFFTELETSLRADYRLCTGDTSHRTLEYLVSWHRSIETTLSSPDYPVIVRKYSEETGILPADARPCEIVMWTRRSEQQVKEASGFLSNERKRLIRKRNESLFLAHELAGVKKASYDFSGIPFGLSKRGFLILAEWNGLAPVTDEGNSVRCDSAALGMYTFRTAFHFNRRGRYWCYEIESETCSADSIDLWARGLMDYMAAHIQKSTGAEPNHIYRIGQFDIVAGRLAICKLWTFGKAAAYVGLCRSKNRYYAKTIVQLK